MHSIMHYLIQFFIAAGTLAAVFVALWQTRKAYSQNKELHKQNMELSNKMLELSEKTLKHETFTFLTIESIYIYNAITNIPPRPSTPNKIETYDLSRSIRLNELNYMNNGFTVDDSRRAIVIDIDLDRGYKDSRIVMYSSIKPARNEYRYCTPFRISLRAMPSKDFFVKNVCFFGFHLSLSNEAKEFFEFYTDSSFNLEVHDARGEDDDMFMHVIDFSIYLLHDIQRLKEIDTFHHLFLDVSAEYESVNGVFTSCNQIVTFGGVNFDTKLRSTPPFVTHIETVSRHKSYTPPRINTPRRRPGLAIERAIER